ncbi:MAG TPA: hypothetical protein VGD40_05175 [Chryseosolibacter sp.]
MKTSPSYSAIYFLLFSIISISGTAQDSRKETEPIYEAVNLSANGFIVGTEKGISYFNSDGSLRWSGAREIEAGDIIASPDGSVVYDMNYFDTGGVIVVGSGKRKGPQYITRYDANGNSTRLEINIDQGFGKNIQAFYCNERYLFSLVTRNGNETNDKKKGDEKLILHRYSNTDFSYKQIALDLPNVSADENSTFWSLIGQSSKGVYLLSKSINLIDNKITFNVVTIDDDGKVVETLTLRPALNSKFLRPAINTEYLTKLRKTTNFLVLQNMESYWPLVGSNSGKAETMTNGSYGHLLYDAQSQSFFAYGLLGRTEKKSEGFYVIKIDRSGKELWRLEEIGSKQLLGESHFVNYPLYARKSILLNSLPNGKQIVSLSFRDTRYLYEIDNAKVTATERLQGVFIYENSANYLFSQPPLKSQQYIKTQKLLEDRNTSTQQLLTPEAEVLLVKTKKKGEILVFKNK